MSELTIPPRCYRCGQKAEINEDGKCQPCAEGDVRAAAISAQFGTMFFNETCENCGQDYRPGALNEAGNCPECAELIAAADKYASENPPPKSCQYCGKPFEADPDDEDAERFPLCPPCRDTARQWFGPAQDCPNCGERCGDYCPHCGWPSTEHP